MAGKIDHADARAFVFREMIHPAANIVRKIADRFGISRQAAHGHIRRMIKDGEVKVSGAAPRHKYEIVWDETHRTFDLAEWRDEDDVWHAIAGPFLTGIPDHISRICFYGFVEIFNNAIDHSGGTESAVVIKRSAGSVKICIDDNGVGIFEKIKAHFGLRDVREAILQLAKGKLTTDATRHSGEGIFFTSRMFDDFVILSSGLFFTHGIERDDWLLEHDDATSKGTWITMTVMLDTDRTPQSIFEKFTMDTPEIENAFARTHVPVRLAAYGPEGIVSRSQARRVLSRFEKFHEVMLDFTGVETIGQPFADEIFRVFAAAHPEIKVVAVHTNPAIDRVIRHVDRAAR